MTVPWLASTLLLTGWHAVAGTDLEPQISLKVEFSGSLLDQYSRDRLSEGLSRRLKLAQACLDTAFQEAGEVSAPQLQLEKVSWMDPDFESALGVHIFDLDREPVPAADPGLTTNTYTLRYYFTSGNHVPIFPDTQFLSFLNSPWGVHMQRYEDLQWEHVQLVESFEGEDGTMVWTEQRRLQVAALDAQASELMAHIQASYDPENVPSIDIEPTNVIRMELVEAAPEDNLLQDQATTLAHELMHAYGSLEDSYADPKQTLPNLMGQYLGGNTCVLTPAQVATIKRNRATAEREKTSRESAADPD